MPVNEDKRRKELKRKFVMGGAAAGVLLGSGYIALTIAGISLTGAPAPPDPIGVRFVNFFLILAACILQSSILGRIAGFLSRKDAGRK